MLDLINPLLHVSRIEIIYKNKVKKADRVPVTSPEDAAVILRLAWDESKIELLEEFKILLLDKGSACLGVASIAQGGISSCAVDARIVFATALLARASKVILAHNHPSGTLFPSRNDIAITRDFVRAGHFLNIGIADHIIIAAEGFCSMREEGHMPQP